MTKKADEQKWQVESDARTMQSMAEIMGDGPRHAKAKAKFDEMLADMEKQKKNMEALKGSKLEYKNTPKGKEKKK